MPTLEQRIQQLEDEAAIRNLVAGFADATTRHDMTALSALWKQHGIFTIGAPLLNVCRGIEEIIGLISKLRGDKEFFVQFVNSGVISVNGDHATARWLIEEVAKGGDKFYHNYCVVSDAMEKVNGEWLFTERFFHFMYLDFSRFTGTLTRFPIHYRPVETVCGCARLGA